MTDYTVHMLIFECVANKEKFVQEDACVYTPKSDAADKMYKSVPIQGYIQTEQRTQKMLCFSSIEDGIQRHRRWKKRSNKNAPHELNKKEVKSHLQNICSILKVWEIFFREMEM